MLSISIRKALPAFIVCALSSAVSGGSFTNHVGRAVSGELTAITNGVAVIGSRRYPLSIFPESERSRMRKMLAIPGELPPALAACRRSLRERWLRNEALLASGAKSPEDAQAIRNRLRSAWRRMLDDAGLDPAMRDFWLPLLPVPCSHEGGQ